MDNPDGAMLLKFVALAVMGLYVTLALVLEALVFVVGSLRSSTPQ